jgi:hypothetical protein
MTRNPNSQPGADQFRVLSSGSEFRVIPVGLWGPPWLNSLPLYYPAVAFGAGGPCDSRAVCVCGPGVPGPACRRPTRPHVPPPDTPSSRRSRSPVFYSEASAFCRSDACRRAKRSATRGHVVSEPISSAGRGSLVTFDRAQPLHTSPGMDVRARALFPVGPPYVLSRRAGWSRRSPCADNGFQ